MQLSVIIPCYNAEATIGEQLEALARQEWDGAWEVVVSDNGSTDRSREVVESYRDRLPALQLVDSSARKGAAYARNVGIEHARGDRLLTCDADDVVADNYVPAMAAALEEHDFVACRLEETRLNEPWLVESWGNGQKTALSEFSPPFLPSAGGGTLGFKRFVFDKVGGFDTEFAKREDNDFCWRVQLAGISLHFAPETAIHYRYPDQMRDMYRQSMALGHDQVQLYKAYRPHGMPVLPLRRALRGKVTWWKLLKRLKNFRRYDQVNRARYIRALGTKIGRAKGSLRYRTLAF